MKLTYKDIDKLIPYEHNARIHDDDQVEQIAASIQEFGFANPVLIDSNNMIIAGHGRVMAAKLLGIKDIPTIELSELTDEQKQAYIIADNKLALNARWDNDILKRELQIIKETDFDMDLIGFSESELSAIFLDREYGETDPYKEWDGMPEFKDNDLCYRKVWVSFDNEDDVNEFFSLIGQGYTEKTKSIWFPEKERCNQKDYEWVDEVGN